MKPAEIGTDAYDRPAIQIRGLDAVIRRKVHDWRYEVFFDLG